MANKNAFIQQLMPHAVQHGKRIGVDPRIIVAQAAQETGWGRSVPNNNFFGIKSHGKGGGQNFTTHEVINGKRVKIKDNFRQYASPAESVAGYADFIASNPRYKSFMGAKGLDAQLAALQKSGYATDPNYSRSVGSIARSIPNSFAAAPPQQPAGQQAIEQIAPQQPQQLAPQQPVDVELTAPQPEQEARSMIPDSIFGLSTKPPEPNSRAMAIANAIGAYGVGLAAGNPAAGLQGASDVARGYTQDQQYAQAADSLGLTPQQRGVLDVLPRDARAGVLAQQAFQKPPAQTELQRNIQLLPEEQRRKALEIATGLSPRAAAASVPNDVAEFQFAKTPEGGGFKGSYADWVNQNEADSTRYSTQPQLFTNPETGESQYGTFGSDGSFKPIDTGGLSPAGPIDKIDLGTEFAIYDKQTGERIGTLPKFNYKEAFDKGKGSAEGKAEGEVNTSLDSLGSKMEGLQNVVDRLGELAKTATYTTGGRLLNEFRKEAGLDPRDEAVARTEYIAMVDNQVLPLLRDTFGAAFTVKEGESLRATLGDPNKTPAEKQVVLNAFIEQKKRDLAALQKRAGEGATPATDNDPLGLRQ